MARKSVKSFTEEKPSRSLNAPKIHLTLKQGAQGQLVVGVSINEFIAYSQNTGFTRLNLIGGKVLEVQETTDQIDRMVRAASSHQNALNPDPDLAFDQDNGKTSVPAEPGVESMLLTDQPEFPGLMEPPKRAFQSLAGENL
jgi:hypothetical protein